MVLAPGQVVLMCKASGDPSPNIVWMRELVNGTITEFGSSTDNIHITEITDDQNITSIFTIQPTSVEDTATYSCRAQNELHSLISQRAQVNIFSRLKHVHSLMNMSQTLMCSLCQI